MLEFIDIFHVSVSSSGSRILRIELTGGNAEFCVHAETSFPTLVVFCCCLLPFEAISATFKQLLLMSSLLITGPVEKRFHYPAANFIPVSSATSWHSPRPRKLNISVWIIHVISAPMFIFCSHFMFELMPDVSFISCPMKTSRYNWSDL